MRVKEWSNTVILRIIRNEKYCGDLVQKKTYTPDFLSHEKRYNTGQEEFVIIKNHHEPIISREMFEKANHIADERSLSQEGKAKHSKRYLFSGKIKCGRCGSSYVARYKKHKDGTQYKAWRCYEAARNGSPHIDKTGNQVGCSCGSIRNEEAVYLMYLVCKELKLNREKIVSNLLKTIDTVLSMDFTDTNISALTEKIEETKKKRTSLIDLYTSGDIDKDEFTALREKYDAEIKNLSDMADGIENQHRMLLRQQELISDIKKAIEELVNGVQYENEFYAQLLDKMVINDRDHIDIYLNMLPHKWSYAVSQSIKGIVADDNSSEITVEKGNNNVAVSKNSVADEKQNITDNNVGRCVSEMAIFSTAKLHLYGNIFR